MKTAVIFHGTGGHPEENWFPWIKKELEKLNYTVIIPHFPTPANQTPESWFEVINMYLNSIISDSILIGHSLGGAFLLRVLESSENRVKAAFFVAVPIGVLPIKYYKTDKPFIGTPFNWEKIRQSATKFFVFHSDNDELVSLGNGSSLAKNLNTELILIKNAGHFNTKSGYIKFELLLNKIKQIK